MNILNNPSESDCRLTWTYSAQATEVPRGRLIPGLSAIRKLSAKTAISKV